MLCSRILLFICFTYGSVYKLIPNFPFISPCTPAIFFGNHKHGEKIFWSMQGHTYFPHCGHGFIADSKQACHPPCPTFRSIPYLVKPLPIKLTQCLFSQICVCAKLLQSCLTFCNPMDHRSPGSSVPGILQARILEWVALPSSRGSSWLRDQTCVSYVSCIGRQVLYH